MSIGWWPQTASKETRVGDRLAVRSVDIHGTQPTRVAGASIKSREAALVPMSFRQLPHGQPTSKSASVRPAKVQMPVAWAGEMRELFGGARPGARAGRRTVGPGGYSLTPWSARRARRVSTSACRPNRHECSSDEEPARNARPLARIGAETRGLRASSDVSTSYGHAAIPEKGTITIRCTCYRYHFRQLPSPVSYLLPPAL